jgi:hypothetical protein
VISLFFHTIGIFWIYYLHQPYACLEDIIGCGFLSIGLRYSFDFSFGLILVFGSIMVFIWSSNLSYSCETSMGEAVKLRKLVTSYLHISIFIYSHMIGLFVSIVSFHLEISYPSLIIHKEDNLMLSPNIGSLPLNWGILD